MLRTFQRAALVEATTYVALCGAMILRRGFDGSNLSFVLGPVHGIAFLVYLWLALQVRNEERWTLTRTLTVLVAAVVPLGGFWVHRQLEVAAGRERAARRPPPSRRPRPPSAGCEPRPGPSQP